MSYERYHLLTAPAPNLAPQPSRFKVRVSRFRLARLLLHEALRYRGDLPLVLSRPCVYGVFSGPIGGFMPRERLCVGCLRCTVEHPSIVSVLPNPEHAALGDSYFRPEQIATVLYEASTGRIPVRGAGYGGGFGGTGWDAMWTDMSEIVRPTRDGIHGRETISTAIEIGRIPPALAIDDQGALTGERPPLLSLPIPILFNWIPLLADRPDGQAALQAAARSLQTLRFAPLTVALDQPAATVPLVEPEEIGRLISEGMSFPMIELGRWDATGYQRLRDARPESVLAVRLPLGRSPVDLAEHGVGVFHLTSDYHGWSSGRFALQAIRETHDQLVRAGLREQVTLIGSGGIVAAEHVAKAIIAGLDAVGLDSAVLVAWQARWSGQFRDPAVAEFELPPVPTAWGAQRIVNLVSSWRDQLLEVLGAMGLREVRRLRGEIGRAMFQTELEAEAFSGIEGYPHGAP